MESLIRLAPRRAGHSEESGNPSRVCGDSDEYDQIPALSQEWADQDGEYQAACQDRLDQGAAAISQRDYLGYETSHGPAHANWPERLLHQVEHDPRR